jgi:hypothetical protein
MYRTVAAYIVTFLLSGNGHCAPTIKTVNVSADGQFTQFTWNISNNNDAQHGQYQQEQWQFTATHSTTRLTFNSQDPKRSGCGAVIACDGRLAGTSMKFGLD